MSDAQFAPMLPPTYHPERDVPPAPLWAHTSEAGPRTSIPPTVNAMNDARCMNTPVDPLDIVARISSLPEWMDSPNSWLHDVTPCHRRRPQ